VSAVLGHADVAFMMRTYVSLWSSSFDGVSNAINAALFAEKPAPAKSGNILETSAPVESSEEPQVAELVGWRGWDRTSDPLINSQLLYR
jgi:hypothetical protein